MPRGGGAIRGVSEQLATNVVTGGGSLNVPLPISPGRGGATPKLSLGYDSAAGNGPFGIGWALSLPRISRHTDRKLPQYHDEEESDAFTLSGGDDLVPVLDGNGERHEDIETVPGFVLHRYRPRVEGSFFRIERWTEIRTGDTHWRSISRDNVTSIYGKDVRSRIADREHVFEWLLCETVDDRGNAVLYDYAAENDVRVDRMLASERNRLRTANRYLKRVRYGNTRSALLEPDLGAQTWLFEVILDYDEGHWFAVPADPTRPPSEQHRFALASIESHGDWAMRPDPFSSYRSGFEIRTYRRCSRVLMFHRFAELGVEPCLVRSLDLDYEDQQPGSGADIDAELGFPGSTRIASCLRRITESGYVRAPGAPLESVESLSYARYLHSSLPPLELTYEKVQIHDDLRALAPSTQADPAAVWIDVDGEGIPGLLRRESAGWLYQANLGRGVLGPVQALRLQPQALVVGAEQFVDLSGDGQLDVAALGGPLRGYYERTDDGWRSFKAFAHVPQVDWKAPNTFWIDLDGDGHADLLITEDHVFTWYPSLAERGFDEPRTTRPATDEEVGPRLVIAVGAEAIFAADMTGDGLVDLVRIRNGEICYWPNLGYARFGAKVTMDSAPRLDHPDQYDRSRVRLVDIDGSGTSDLVYLGRDGVRLYFNCAGNGWTDARRMHSIPAISDPSSVSAADLLGSGTACIVWSSPLPAAAGAAVRYLDLLDGRKPHLLVGIHDHRGAETRITYAPSTKFYLADKRAGTPWTTRVPFPVHVIERVETHDRVSDRRMVSQYTYHHGHYDAREREFRGFGRIDQLDSEQVAAFAQGPLDLPPALAKTWFHTGSDAAAGSLAREYFQSEAAPLAMSIRGTTSANDEREAFRALRGSMLRREIYALDGSSRAEQPYQVVERGYTVECLQPRGQQRHAVMFAHQREEVTKHYERATTPVAAGMVVADAAIAVTPGIEWMLDPRILHTIVLEVDAVGTVLKAASVAYGRPWVDPSLPADVHAAQQATLVSYTETRTTNGIDGPTSYRTPLICETQRYELTGYQPTGASGRFQTGDFVADAPDGLVLVVDSTGGRQSTLLNHSRVVFRRNDLASALPHGALESSALPFESYRLALTPSLIEQTFSERMNQTLLEGAGYVRLTGSDGWWVPSGRVFYAPAPTDPTTELAHARAHFYLVHRAHDAFHSDLQSTAHIVRYDRYDLLVEEVVDPVGNRISAGQRSLDPTALFTRMGNDYRVLQPALAMDPNRNLTATAYDALGGVAGTAVMGKPEGETGEVTGDRISATFRADLTTDEIVALLTAPAGPLAAELLGEATTRTISNVTSAWRSPDPALRTPITTASISRTAHGIHPAARVEIEVHFSDGMGQTIQTKRLAEADGDVERWTVSGWELFDNKGNAVRRYQPYFSGTHRFERDVRAGQSPVIFYDPLSRRVGTLYPDHTWDKPVIRPWRNDAWDASDTVLVTAPSEDAELGDRFARIPSEEYLPTWHARRASGALGPDAQSAAQRSELYADTPATVHHDPLGRAIATVERNRWSENGTTIDETYTTRVQLDIDGRARAITDARDRIAETSEYDLLGRRIRVSSIDGGQRWMLSDAAGKPMYAWNSRGHRSRSTYDALQRPLESFLREGTGAETLVGLHAYGETASSPETTNRRGRPRERRDQAGVIAFDRYDVHGNPVIDTRTFVPSYARLIDWAEEPLPTAEPFIRRTSFDALGRRTQIVTAGARPHVLQPSYDLSGRFHRLDVWLDRVTTPEGLIDRAIEPPAAVGIEHVGYNANGQRLRIDYKVATGSAPLSTEYSYSADTLRLERRFTPSPTAAPNGIQDLRFTYDVAGNTTIATDEAQQDIFFSNMVVGASAAYTYDAVFRLIESTGREHLGQLGGEPIPYSDDDAPRTARPHPEDGRAMGRYRERYRYDPVGNLLEIQHRGTGSAAAGWSRSYGYADANNRLTSSTVGSDTASYTYDAHGSVTAMPHLPVVTWNERDQLHMTQRQVGNGADRTYYVYDGIGQRVRKITEHASGQIKDERLYLGEIEIYRRYGASPLVRETLHATHDDRHFARVELRRSGNEPGIPSTLIRYQLDDRLGSAVLELDNRAGITSYEEYTPFGSTSYQGVASQLEAPRRYRYTGRERDEESGFSYHGARYYAPWLGRWTSADPAGSVDGPNLYRYARNNPLRWIDPGGHQPAPDPNAPSTFVGGGVTIGGGKVQLGPTMPVPLSECDELNPACKTLTFALPGSNRTNPTPAPSPDPAASSNTPGWARLWAPQLPDYLWRKIDPSTNLSPHDVGMVPRNPGATYTAGEHVAQDFPVETGTQFLSASHKPGGATNIQGEPYAINPDALPPETKVIDTPEIAADYQRRVREGAIDQSRYDSWSKAQQTTEGVPTKPGAPLRGEALIEGGVPPEAFEGAGLRGLRGVGRALFWTSVVLTVEDLVDAFIESARKATPLPFLREAVRQTATWGLAISMGADGAAIGLAIGGPVGAVVGGLVGGFVGAVAGWISGSWLASLF